MCLSIEPLEENQSNSVRWLIAFRDVGPSQILSASVGPFQPADKAEVLGLEQELRRTQEMLRIATDELEANTEDGKSVGEEYQSVNEELQSSNEELETAKEEMQSVNEELQTVNGEALSKNELLVQINNDLQNLMDSTEIAIVFLDSRLRIKTFTPAAKDIFRLRDTDRGRPLSDIVSSISSVDLAEDVEKAMRKLTMVEREVQIKDVGSTFILRVRPYRTLDNRVDGVVLTLVDISERKRSQTHIEYVMKELSHRSKNLLAVVQAIANQTGRSVSSMPEFKSRFDARLRGLMASHDVLIDEAWQGGQLRELVLQQLKPFVPTDGSRLMIEGPNLTLSKEATQSIGLVLHELATNAVKYGALSGSVGTVWVTWTCESPAAALPRFYMSWQEKGGPAVSTTQRQGFGQTVIKHMIAQSLAGDVELDYAPDGVSWSIDAPAHVVLASTSPNN